MATAILTQPTPTINLSAIALGYVESIDATANMYLIERMCCELDAMIELTGDDELDTTQVRYAYLMAAGEDVGFSDLPACLW